MTHAMLQVDLVFLSPCFSCQYDGDCMLPPEGKSNNILLWSPPMIIDLRWLLNVQCTRSLWATLWTKCESSAPASVPPHQKGLRKYQPLQLGRMDYLDILTSVCSPPRTSYLYTFLYFIANSDSNSTSLHRTAIGVAPRAEGSASFKLDDLLLASVWSP